MVRVRLYSDRLRDAAAAGLADVYQYDQFPPKLRTQIRRILRNVFGKDSAYDGVDEENNEVAQFIRETICQEKGRDSLGGSETNPMKDLLFHLEHGDGEAFLDVIDVAATVMNGFIRGQQGQYRTRWDSSLDADEGLEEINFRFRDAGVGFQIEGGKLIRVDSQFAHSEMIKPALSLLNSEEFSGPQAEFLTAHEHYRAGRYKEAITEAAKAFESLMKAVCDAKCWEYPAGARASDLLKVLRGHNLWPTYLDPSFDQLIATLASGLPKVRDAASAHGQGAVRKKAPQYVAAYALHIAAAKMILIVEAAQLSTPAN